MFSRQGSQPISDGSVQRGPSSGLMVCHYCSQAGHYRSQCPEISCFECGQFGHVGRVCPQRRFRQDDMAVEQQPSVNIRVAQRQQESQHHRSFVSSPQFTRGSSSSDARRASIRRGKQPVGQMTRGGVHAIDTADPQPPTSQFE